MKTVWKANRTTHSLSEETGLVSHLFGDLHANLPELFQIGAVYVNKKRTLDDVRIRSGDYVRIHGLPKRFRLDGIPWDNLVVAEGEEYLIVNKPSGIPVHATIDNILENLVSGLSKRRGYPLLVTHRLDAVTSGILCLAKTPKFQAWFNRQLSRRKVQKKYYALVQHRPLEGLWLHWAKNSPSVPKELFRKPAPDATLCETIVSDVAPWKDIWKVTLHPRTGRTHQLRAQMGLEGCPILGDTLYGGEIAEGFDGTKVALHSTELRFPGPPGSNFSFRADPPVGVSRDKM